MVRTNQKTGFSFPFISPTKDSVIQPTYLDKTDRLLSSFAISFFMAVLLLISLDGANTFNINKATPIWSSQGNAMASTLLFANGSFSSETKTIEKPLVEKNISPSTIIIAEPKMESVKPKKVKAERIEKIGKAFIPNSVVKKNYTIKSHSSSNKVSAPRKEFVKTTFTSNTKPQPKRYNAAPVILKKETVTKKVKVAKKEVTEALVINEAITSNLLPTSYFEAKATAAKEGKLLLIKFGAKWCLPCRQMNQNTFKNQKVIDLLDKDYVKLDIDVDDFDGVNLQSYYNVKMLPTMLVFNSHGIFLAKYSKFVSANRMIEVLESHAQQEVNLPIKEILTIDSNPIAKSNQKYLAPKVIFKQIQLKKTVDGRPINQFRTKAKNWRFTSLHLGIQNMETGILKVNIVEKKSGKSISNLEIPYSNLNKNLTDTTTTDFQLDLPLEKRKKKGGEYVLEIYHVSQNSSNLIGATTIARDGNILAN